MRKFQIPDPQDVAIILLLILAESAWALGAFTALTLFLLITHHWIIGGLFGAITAFACYVRRQM
jgi:hypothetical protein